MSSDMRTPSRRGFLRGGAMLGAPLAMATPTAAFAGRDGKDRLERLEAEDAVRLAHQAWIAAHNKGTATVGLEGVRSLTTDPKGDAEIIALSEDGKSATLTMAALVETATDLPRDCTLAEMAYAQGSGTLCHSERRRLTASYARTKNGWEIMEAAFV